MISLSYLITVHDEDSTLKNLLERILSLIESSDEIIILDDFSDNSKTKQILLEYSEKPNVRVCQHALDKNYGAHKNYGNELCKGNWIFQIDADELPSETLLLNIKDIISINEETELFLVPRINDFKGVTHEHARHWGWVLTSCSTCSNRPIVNWPDYQGRIYKNDSTRIKWDRRLHEKIEGYKKYTSLPSDYDFALYHDKTIETQLKTNKRYNEWFTADENRGHAAFAKK